MIRSILSKLVGDTNEREVKRLRPTIEKINRLEEEYQALTDDALKAKTVEFRERLAAGASLDDLLPEAFAVVKNACRRISGTSWSVRGTAQTWDMVPYDVQLIGGIVLHSGKISEMKTGEGKTLVSALPLYLNALAGKGAHLITANNYLARRDAEWIGGLLNYLGLTVGVVDHGMTTPERQAAYACDVTYGTNTEFGFDYLRDNMARVATERVQRDLHFAIVDEVDSILIDEARTPLIISAAAEESTEKYIRYSQLIPQLTRDTHFILDEKAKTVTLTEEGIAKMEGLLGLSNIYTDAGFAEVHHIEQALKAHAVFTRDKDYIVSDDGEIVIVDEFTGRLMPGRRYSDGLHQALEAKERVEVKRESVTLATITLQNYFRMYTKLAGMTGTAITEAEEFAKIYKLDVVTIPTHRPVSRLDHSDAVFKNERGKFSAITAKVKELHAKGQPVLIGTVTIEKSERLSHALQQAGIPHAVLNAKHHEKEAEIIARAGERDAVTIATNMAGRGTDIKLGDGVAELGGLFILGTERHESRRIDNQLRGRAGRQGDPGASQFFVSMEDNLMRLFGGAQMQKLMEALNVPEDMPIENGMISGSIESAQKKVEAHNFEIRKHLVEYDDVMNKHREIIYSRRKKVLEHENIADEIQSLTADYADNLVQLATTGRDRREWNLDDLARDLSTLADTPVTAEKLAESVSVKELKVFVTETLKTIYAAREKAADPAVIRNAERQVYLQTIDRLWMDHLEAMRYLREKVALRGYGQRDPLIEYKSEAYELFHELLGNIRGNTVTTLFKLQFAPLQAATAPVITIRPTIKPAELQTNEKEVEDVLTGDRELTPDQPVMTDEVKAAVEQFLKVDTNVSTLGKDGVATVRADNDVEEPTKVINPTVIRVSADSSPAEQSTVGRNDLCPCGSGKKYKKCHGSHLGE